MFVRVTVTVNESYWLVSVVPDTSGALPVMLPLAYVRPVGNPVIVVVYAPSVVITMFTPSPSLKM